MKVPRQSLKADPTGPKGLNLLSTPVRMFDSYATDVRYRVSPPRGLNLPKF
jgi:hypothetical protein